MDRTAVFELERARLVTLASRVLSDSAEAEDVVQLAWLRLDSTQADILNLPGWLTTVTTRLCLDRLRARVPVAVEEMPDEVHGPDPTERIELAESVGAALHVVLDRLSPAERVALVLHDSFGVEFTTVAEILDVTPAAARQLASRARRKVGGADEGHRRADARVVDAFMAAARNGEFERLLGVLAPQVEVGSDAAAILAGTPERISGRQEVAEFFNGSAHAALPVTVGGRPGAAWFHRGEAKVLFDFTVQDGLVGRIDFRADPDVLAGVVRRAPDPIDD
ncbi:Sigma-70 region 2 [Aeromicrobium marinum DSM 15272]|uniref:Sigma-70 region 2 n=1 Tax=Aeromicrobium marinum DSM 15272 TaxID=585531 RepID=E2SCF8_9ACTN|nr:sigma-70 family RNA polymerase sigma factor [Aeromicrobium marinum]EFQ82911.1 Sigma-70 region 2 [Aeromicrobium marinum DSM 15272]